MSDYQEQELRTRMLHLLQDWVNQQAQSKPVLRHPDFINLMGLNVKEADLGGEEAQGATKLVPKSYPPSAGKRSPVKLLGRDEIRRSGKKSCHNFTVAEALNVSPLGLRSLAWIVFFPLY